MNQDRAARPQVVLVNRSFIRRDEDDKLLFLKRSMNDNNYPGLWECPGGKVDVGQDLVHALEREVMEETGFLVEPIQKLVHTDSYVIGDGKYAGLSYIVLFSVTKVVGGIFTLSHEHDEHKWVTHSEALRLELTPEVRKATIVLQGFLA